jgi:gluconate kinase
LKGEMMRMWMVDVKRMCRKHLLGEHVELHMLVGHLKRKKGISGFIKNNCMEPRSIFSRHQEIVEEMSSRGYLHRSLLANQEEILDYLSWEEKDAQVDIASSLAELVRRCQECRKGHTDRKR